jgi:hypothetical protein
MGQTNQTLQDTNQTLKKINESIKYTDQPIEKINQTLKNTNKKSMFFSFPIRIINMNKIMGVKNMCTESTLRIFGTHPDEYLDEKFTNPVHCQTVFDKLSEELQANKLQTNPCMCCKYH